MDENQLIETVVQTAVKELSRKITLDFAVRLIERVEKKAAEMGIPVVVAVSDAAGRPVAVHSMDGAYIGSFDIAINKTFTSIAFQMPTKTLSTLSQPGGDLYGIQNTNQGKVVIFGGGEPLYYKGMLMGAIGVSGGNTVQDTALGEYGEQAFREMIACS